MFAFLLFMFQAMPNAQQFQTASGTPVTITTSFRSGSITLTADTTVSSMTPGVRGGQPFHLTVLQSGGVAHTLTWPASGVKVTSAINSTGPTFLDFIWDVPTAQWVQINNKGDVGATGSNGSQGPAGVLYYNSSGVAVPSVKCIMGNLMSTTSGTWTGTFISSPLTTVTYCNAMVKSSGQTAALSNQATITSCTVNGISGAITAPVAISILGALPIALGTTSLPVYYEVCGQ